MNCTKTTLDNPVAIVNFDTRDGAQLVEDILINKISAAGKAIKTLNDEHVNLKRLQNLKNQISIFDTGLRGLYRHLSEKYTENQCLNIYKLMTSVDRLLAVELTSDNKIESKKSNEQITTLDELVATLNDIVKNPNASQSAEFLRQSRTTLLINDLFAQLTKYLRCQHS